MIPHDQWKWFGNAGHFICADRCQFHLCTQIGSLLVSTVGQYRPDAAVRKILADARGVAPADYEEIGCGRTFETMAFALKGTVCKAPGCDCGLPEIVPSELDFQGYNNAGDAMCEKAARGEVRA